MEYANWFIRGKADVYFFRNLMPYAGQPIQCLQIGAYTGDATQWLFDNVLTHPESTLLDVDTWEGSDESEHKTIDWKSVEDTYLERHAEKLKSGRLKVYKGTSDSFFASEEGKRGFHFIYIDGGHEAPQVLKDGINAVHRVGLGGIVAFDDYLWTQGKGIWADPKPAVDGIVACYSNEFQVIDNGLQIWIKRVKEPK